MQLITCDLEPSSCPPLAPFQVNQEASVTKKTPLSFRHSKLLITSLSTANANLAQAKSIVVGLCTICLSLSHQTLWLIWAKERREKEDESSLNYFC